MRDQTGAGPGNAQTFELLKSATTGVVAVLVFMFSTAGAALLVVAFAGLEINPALGLLIAFCLGAVPALLVVVFGESDQCARIAFDHDSIRLTGSRSGEVVLPKRAVQMVFERASLDSRAPPSFWLYGAAFGRIRLQPAAADAADLDAALRKALRAALHIPAARKTRDWQWPRKFDHGELISTLRLEARSRERRSVIIGSIATIAGAGGSSLVLLTLFGVVRASGSHLGRGLGASILLLAFGIFLLAATRRTTRWRKACEAVISQRVNASFACPACGYETGGLKPGTPCPECGKAPPSEPPLDLRDQL